MSIVTETVVQETIQFVENVQGQRQTESKVSSVENKKESSAPASANLIPAPIPTSSPWKSVNNDIPVTSISVEDLESLKKKSPTPSIKSHTSTKWVPIKASITVSNTNTKNGNKNKNHHRNHNGKRNSNNNKNKQSNSKKNKKNSNTNKTQDKTGIVESSQPVTCFDETASTATSAVDEKQTSTENNDSNTPENESGEQQHPHNNNNNNNKHKRSNTKHHPHHFNSNNNDNNRKFHGKHQQGQLPNGFNPKQNNNNVNFHHSNNNQKHRSFRPQQMAQLYSMLYPFHYSMMAVNSVARQIEYYLSDENLATDDYLKQHLSKDGYVPLSLLSKFYRLLNMSFGGDLNIIMAALREIVFNENATVEVVEGEQIITPVEENNQEEESKSEEPKESNEESKEKNEGEGEDEKKMVTEPSPLTKYFVRSKNWEKWLPENPTLEVEVHKKLSGNDLDAFMLKMVTVPHHHNHHHHNHHSHHNHRNNQQPKEDENTIVESNESTNETTPVNEAIGSPVEPDNASAPVSSIDGEKSIPVEDNSKESSVPVEVNQSS